MTTETPNTEPEVTPVPTIEPEVEAEAEPTDEVDARVFYVTPNFRRFFAVPRDVQVSAGSLDVLTLAGGYRKVDEESIRAYEIEDAAARDLFRAKVKHVAHGAGKALERGGDRIKDAASHIRPDAQRAADAFAETLGVTREQLLDPDAVFSRLKDKVQDLGRKVRGMRDEEPASADAPPASESPAAEEPCCCGESEAPRRGLDSMLDAARKMKDDVAEHLDDARDKVRSAADRLLHRDRAEAPSDETPKAE